MCSIRGFLVFEHDGNILYSRRYPTVEKRVLRGNPQTIPLPSDMKISAEALRNIFRGTVDPTIEKVDIPLETEALLDKCCEISAPQPYLRTPVHSLFEEKLWPVVVVKKQGWIFLAIPEINGLGLTETKNPSDPYVTATIAFLEVISDLAGPYLEKKDPIALAELNHIINTMAPFGTPIETSIVNVKSIMKATYPEGKISLGAQDKQPAWKPIMYRGKPKIDFTVREEVRAVLYGVPGKSDQIDIQGIVFCKAELEGTPDLTVSLSSPQTFTSITVHRTVQPPDTIANPVLCFSPPLTPFQLCRYSLSLKAKRLPLAAHYQMKEMSSNCVKIVFSIQMDNEIHLGLQYCDIVIPFLNRPPVSRIDGAPTVGSVRPITNKHGIVWEVGDQVATRNREASVVLVVYFEPQGKVAVVDPFLTGANSYAEVRIKAKEIFSGTVVDTKNIQIYPAVKPTVTLEKETITAQYLVWNSLGESISAYNPPSLESLFVSSSGHSS
eukprot:TRINITY_DN4012_c0_g1_i3.p1 TRINITY_DN4012_c0_g1~~TRINITY_DN4012_c0_g1_i3.p1  ORF type:complete len:496 (+),score=103.74 TRINITY_DN4012_c0_g1_i3:50-1537(+)